MTDKEPWRPPFTGLIHVTGEPDTGKTSLCLTVPGVLPPDIWFFDDDLKTRSIAQQAEKVGRAFGAYFDLTTESKLQGIKKPIAFFNFVMAKLSSLTERVQRGEIPRPKVIVFDNWSRMEGGIRAYSQEILSEISDISPGQARAMSQLTWGATYEEYSRILSLFISAGDMFFLTTHTKEKYMAPGVLESRGQRPITEKAIFRVWLRHNDNSPAPIGLILKRISRMEFSEDGMKPVNVLPRKIKPCTWEKIYQYFETPIGNRSPEKDEVPNDFELSILDGTLTEDQKIALRAMVDQKKAEETAEQEMMLEAQEAAELEMASEARRLKADGKSLPQIVKSFAGAVTVAQVAKWLSASE